MIIAGPSPQDGVADSYGHRGGRECVGIRVTSYSDLHIRRRRVSDCGKKEKGEGH